jgi:hypothetical protein
MEIPMLIANVLKSAMSSPSIRRQSIGRRPPVRQLSLEAMEHRRLLSFSPAATYPVGLSARAAAASDFNNDGRADVVVANYGQDTVSVMLGTGNGAFQPPRASASGMSPKSIWPGDLNGDGKMDLVTFNINPDDPASGFLGVLLGNGDGQFRPPSSLALPPQTPPGYNGAPLAQAARCAFVCDLNADGRVDVVAGGSTLYRVVVGFDHDTHSPIYEYHADGYVDVLLGNGNGTFGVAAAYHSGFDPNNLSAGDFDGDGKLDVVTDVGGLTTFPGNGDGTLRSPRRTPGYSIAAVGGGSGLPLADFNRDGKLDVLMREASDNALVVMLGNGDGTFRQTESVFVGALHTATVGDVNVDGKLDVVVLNSNYTDETYADWASSAHVLLGRGDGTLASPIISEMRLPPENYFTSAGLADFDGDGYPELSAAASTAAYYEGQWYDGPGVIAVSHNDGNWATKTWIGAGSGGNWSTAGNWSPSGVPTASDLVAISAKSVNLSSSATVAGLTLTGGATLTLDPNGNRVLRTSLSSISSDSTLNLNDNALIVDYSGAAPLDSIRASLHSGYAGGAWNGTGITSGAAATNRGTGIGFAEASELFSSFPATFAGQSVDDTSVLLRYTLLGDANQDGGVDVTDLGILATNWQGTNKTFGQGDFNYDRMIDVTDLGILATNWQKSLPIASSTMIERSLPNVQSMPGTRHRTNELADLSQSVLS